MTTDMNEIMTIAIAVQVVVISMGNEMCNMDVNTVRFVRGSEPGMTGWRVLSSGTVAVETSSCITEERFRESTQTNKK